MQLEGTNKANTCWGLWPALRFIALGCKRFCRAFVFSAAEHMMTLGRQDVGADRG